VPGTTTTTLPAGPPEGFTEQQFRTFVDVVQACGPDPGAVCSRVLAWTGNRAVAETTQWIVDVPLAVIVIVLLALAANWLVRRGISRYLERLDDWATRTGEEDPDRSERRALRKATASSTLGSAAGVVIFAIAIFVSLGQFDINLGPLLAGAGIAGVALGFGAQNIVRDVLAGVFVIVEDQYGIGDIIDAGRASGVVEGVSLRTTKIRDVEGTLWFVPNGTIQEVGNMTQRWARVILDVDVAYGSDHHRAAELIKGAADEMWKDAGSEARILEEPEMWGVERLGESSVALRLAVKSAPADQWKVARELRSRIKDSFDTAGVEIPFPQRTLWVRDGPGPARDGPGPARGR
jgi:moderate conductance mechanosensitive channel